MPFISILDKEESSYLERRKPEFFLDLNLDQIIEQIQQLWSWDIKKYFSYFPENEACEAYRREVFSDVKREGVWQVLNNYVNRMRERKEALYQKLKVDYELQKDVWQLWEVYDYCQAFEELYEGLSGQELHSEGMRELLAYLKGYLSSGLFLEMREKAYALHRELMGFQLVLTIENDQVVIAQKEASDTREDGEAEAKDYESFLEESFPGHKKQLRSPFAADPNLSNLEQELIVAFRKKHPDFFKEAAKFYQVYFHYEDEILMRFDEEIGFYLAFYRFEEKMRDEGFAFAVPVVDSKEEMRAAGLYDLALACVNVRQKKEVVSNDMVYHNGESFFVVTGPNQGGKTTFARSLGQLVYFAKMGLDVPALSASVPYFSDLLTHFSVEESIETGRGKLKEELTRLAPMMNDVFDHAFVIINELFTTAASFDACIMGKRVLEHFLGQNCCGVYVTHLKELSEGDGRIVSLRALVEEVEQFDNEQGGTRIRNVRKFKMIRSAAEDTGYAGDLVEKYHLTYEELRKRLEG